jgi:hypothetical protein
MKTAICALLFLLSLASTLRASSPIFIDFTTNDDATTYTVNHRQMTPAEIEAWFRETVRLFGDRRPPTILRPDKRTSFSTVFDILRRLKNAGVKSYEIVDTSTTSGSVLDEHLFVGTADNIRNLRSTLPPAPTQPDGR